jgi:hypothetical protein
MRCRLRRARTGISSVAIRVAHGISHSEQIADSPGTKSAGIRHDCKEPAAFRERDLGLERPLAIGVAGAGYVEKPRRSKFLITRQYSTRTYATHYLLEQTLTGMGGCRLHPD